METIYYTCFSVQRTELRKEWNAQIRTGERDWEIFLYNAEVKKQIENSTL